MIVIGPAGNLGAAMTFAFMEQELDGAILDVCLQGELVFPVAMALRQRAVPFIFATGYGSEFFPEGLGEAPRLQKPFEADVLPAAIRSLIADRVRMRRFAGA
ncbi:response regulator [Chelatococcus sambhunathii]|uniref:Response regulator n=1 Tax=Chelatococcus sambhunathii TaxID=363953 RepID=A0ABU1DI72_9HYPH|nr:response regulator [Chelatococcus sambhunathii]MDR4307595.1 response regulator [Chelatococcus sambhunathii]